MSRLRLPLRVVGLVIALGTLVFWASSGAHRGWSKDRVAIEKTDEVTGLEYREFEERFVPGIDVLAIGLAAGLGLAAVSFLFRNQKPTS